MKNCGTIRAEQNRRSNTNFERRLFAPRTDIESLLRVSNKSQVKSSKLDLQLKRAMAINKALKKEKAELHKFVQSQELRKKELDAGGELKIAKESPDNLFLQPLQPDLAMQQGLEPGDASHKTQNSIAIPAIHSLEGNSNTIEYSVGTIIRDPITEIAL